MNEQATERISVYWGDEDRPAAVHPKPDAFIDEFNVNYIRADIHDREIEMRTAQVDALQERVAELEGALVPFSAYSRLSGADFVADDFQISQGSSFAAPQITMGDCRRARAALSSVEGTT